MKPTETYMRELRAWLAETENTPLEEMDAFFTRRLDGYEAHMLAHWADDYKNLADALPPGAKRILDLGCGTGLELDEIFRASRRCRSSASTSPLRCSKSCAKSTPGARSS